MEREERRLPNKEGGGKRSPSGIQGRGAMSRRPILSFLGGSSLFFLLGALVRDGVESALLGVIALALGLAFLLVATRGTRGHGVARVAAGVGGAGVLTGALGIAAVSLWMIFVEGGLGILLGMVGIPASFVLGLLGRLLIEMARSGLERRNTTGGRGASPLPPFPAPPAPGSDRPGR